MRPWRRALRDLLVPKATPGGQQAGADEATWRAARQGATPCGMGHVRAAATAAVANLLSHNRDAVGDASLSGPHRRKMSEARFFVPLSTAALFPARDPSAFRTIRSSCASGIMFLAGRRCTFTARGLIPTHLRNAIS